MGSLARLEQFQLGAPSDDLFAIADEGFDDVPKCKCFRTAASNRKHVRREARLGGRVPPDLVQNHFGSCIALEVDDDPDALAIGTSSRISATPSIRRSLAASAIFSTSPDFPT